MSGKSKSNPAKTNNLRGGVKKVLGGGDTAGFTGHIKKFTRVLSNLLKIGEIHYSILYYHIFFTYLKIESEKIV